MHIRLVTKERRAYMPLLLLADEQESMVERYLHRGDRGGMSAMHIRLVTKERRAYMPLLLLADEQESMVERYLHRGELYVMEDPEAVAVCLVTDEGDGVLEIKNLAVAPHRQRQGLGRAMVEHAARCGAGQYRVLQVGTGDSPDGVLEIKNLAVAPHRQRQGLGRAMVEHAARCGAGQYRVLQVGTGDSPLTIPFYESCGFCRSHSIPDFFTENYDHPIYEGGVLLKDMVYLRRSLTP